MATDKYIARWTLNNTLNDISGNEHTLSTSSGSVVYSSDGPGNQGACTLGSYYLKATGITINEQSTISLWGKTSTSGKKMLWGYKNNSSQNLDLYCDGIYSLNTGDIKDNPFKDFYGEDISVLTDNKWHLFTVTFGSFLQGQAMLYLDGVYRGHALSYRNPVLNNGTFAIGSWTVSNDYIWEGGICDVRIYNRILSPEDILTLYKEKGMESNLLGPKSATDKTQQYWNMATTTTTGLQEFTKSNTFSVPDLSSTGLTEEGFCERTYKVTLNTLSGYENTSTYKVESGAAVVIQNNSFEDEDDVKLSGLGVAKNIVGDNVYNAVWNDMVDCIQVPKNTVLEYGRCYVFDGKNYRFSSKYLENGILGIHSDTAGFYVGAKEDTYLEIAIAGFALAFVDKEYKPGTPLTCGENGCLTELKEEDIEKNSYKIVGTFWKKEWGSWWGFNKPRTDEHIIETNGRMWIKVK